MSLFRLSFAAAVAIAILTFLCHGQSPKPPEELGFLSTFGQVHERYPYEAWGQVTFPAYGENQVNKRGRHWSLWVAIPGSKERMAGWGVVKPAALKAGWTVVSE